MSRCKRAGAVSVVNPLVAIRSGDCCQCIALAYNLVEKRLREGTATSQETTHFLRLGSTIAKYEQDILKAKKEMMEAKTDQIQSQKRVEELYANALSAMRSYGLHSDDEED